MKFYVSSTCEMGFLAMAIALWLPSLIVVGLSGDALMSVSNLLSHIYSFLSSCTESNVLVDKAITGYCLLNQLIAAPDMTKRVLVVECQLSKSPHHRAW